MKRTQLASILAAFQCCFLVPGQSVVTMVRSPEVNPIPAGQTLTMSCTFTELTSEVDEFYWVKTQDSPVLIYHNTGRYGVPMADPQHISFELRQTGSDESVLQLTIAQVTASDEGVYACGSASSVSATISDGTAVVTVNVSQVPRVNASMEVWAHKKDGVAVFSSPNTAICRVRLREPGGRAVVEFDGRSITDEFSEDSLELNWDGNTPGFKELVQKIDLYSYSFLPPSNGTLTCGVYDDELGDYIFMDNLRVVVPSQTLMLVTRDSEEGPTPAGSRIQLSCIIVNVPSHATEFYWEKVQDVAVHVYYVNESYASLPGEASPISGEKYQWGDEIISYLTIHRLHESDAGTYRCGYASPANRSVRGVEAAPAVSVSQVDYTDVSLIINTEEVNSSYLFSEPREVSCKAALRGVGQTVVVKFDGRDITSQFPWKDLKSMWLGFDAGFKSPITIFSVESAEYFPVTNGTLTCAVYGGTPFEQIASASALVSINTDAVRSTRPGSLPDALSDLTDVTLFGQSGAANVAMMSFMMCVLFIGHLWAL